MIKNGCDLRIVKELLQHNDIATALRYAHVAETIDLNKVEVLELAISNKEGEEGGQGEVIIDQIE